MHNNHVFPLCLFGPNSTSTRQLTIHWMSIMTFMGVHFHLRKAALSSALTTKCLHRVNIWFHHGNLFCKK
jgi:hypothetical protein